MLMAQGQILETLLGLNLGQLSVGSSANIKSDLKRNAEKFVLNYTGGTTDVALLQQEAALLQSEIDRIIERSEDVEKAIRQQTNKPS
jgi:hypothetical protein